MDVISKACTKCKKEKLLIEFANQKLGKYGKRATCKECHNADNRAYKKTDRGAELRRKWKRSECGKKNSKVYREKHADEIKEFTKSERYKISHRKSTDLQRFGGNRLIALKRDGNKCTLCKSSELLQVHHKDEMGRNKPRTVRNNDIDNLVTLCAKCHIEQHNPVLVRWNKV